MGKEVDMKDADDKTVSTKAGSVDKKTVELVKKVPETPSEILAELQSARGLVERAVVTKESRIMARAVRLLLSLRKKLKGSILITFVKHNLPADSEVQSRLLGYLSKIQVDEPAAMDSESLEPVAAEKPSDSDAIMSDDAVDATAKSEAKDKAPEKPAVVRPTSLPEMEIFTSLAVLMFLIDQKAYAEAKECSWAAVRRLQQLNRRTLDLLAARVAFYFSLVHERTNSLAEIRSTLLALNQTATLRHDEIGQEMLLNLLLRNYLHYNLYELAEKLRSKALRAETHSNQQLCRYLYYLGRTRAIQLEYSEAKECLQQAIRKAPTAALGFRIECTKWSVLVRLLLGEIPERTVFVAAGMKALLRPYFELTNAVRVGDLELFQATATRFADVFASDRVQNLVVRLRHNVIRTALRRLSLAYSRISLTDVAAKLHLNGPTAEADAECIVAKAIRDGGIDAILQHDDATGLRSMVSRESGDVYSSLEPQAAFHTRVAFCLDLHNDAVKAMQFPPSSRKDEADAEEKRRERQQAEQELAQHIAEEGDDDY